MPSTISRLKPTDSLGQWASKTNQIIDTVEGFLSSSGSITSGNTTNNIAAYSGSAWIGYPASGDATAAISAGNLVFTLTTAAFTGKTVTSSITPASDLILIYSGGAVKTVTPATISTPGGSNTYVQYNNSGAFGGASGFTFASGILSVPTGLNVNTNNLYVGSSKVGIGTGSPAQTLDVAGTIGISGTQVLSSTTLGSGVVNSSLTSVGTLTSLSVSGAGSFGSISSSGAIQGASLAITGAAAVTGVLTGRTNVVSQSTSLNPTVAQTTYAVGANSITLTLPGSPATGDKISFVSTSSSINNYTVARNGNVIMGLSSDLTVDMAAAFDLLWTGTGWVLS
jgi:hypothetical protein